MLVADLNISDTVLTVSKSLMSSQTVHVQQYVLFLVKSSDKGFTVTNGHRQHQNKVMIRNSQVTQIRCIFKNVDICHIYADAIDLSWNRSHTFT